MQPNISTRLSRSAFTLIELLVVMSIVSLLISILLPALASARKVAKTIRCTSNLRQIASTLGTYDADYHGYWPAPDIRNGEKYYAEGVGTYSNNSFSVHWDSTELFPHMQGSLFSSDMNTKWVRSMKSGSSIFACPSWDDGFDGTWGNPDNVSDLSLRGYGMNVHLAAVEGGKALTAAGDTSQYYLRHEKVYKRTRDLLYPSQEATILDMADSYTGRVILLNSGNFANRMIKGVGRLRHKESINILFADGHAALVPIENIPVGEVNAVKGDRFWGWY
jgi:prepilin-type N-terminal cleavage/methylation domain-containing protein/prepilin-type processing-associated H-X9-DG protein